MTTQPPTTYNLMQPINYQDGLFLTSSLMNSNQQYIQQLSQYLNLNLLTPGVLSGLDLSLSGGNQTLSVTPGVAVDSLGRLLVWSGTEGTPTPINVPAPTGTGTSDLTISYPTVPQVAAGLQLLIPTFSLQSGSGTNIKLGTVSYNQGSFTSANSDGMVNATLKLSGGTGIPEIRHPAQNTEQQADGDVPAQPIDSRPDGIGTHTFAASKVVTVTPETAKGMTPISIPMSGASFSKPPVVVASPQSTDAPFFALMITHVAVDSFDVRIHSFPEITEPVTVTIHYQAHANEGRA